MNGIKPEIIPQIIDKNYDFIDLRDPFQYKKLHIRNFINMSSKQLLNKQFSKQKTIILICYQGEEAKEMARLLNQKGYQAYYVEGGFHAFINKPNQKYF